jgi:hypothetical protein
MDGPSFLPNDGTYVSENTQENAPACRHQSGHGVQSRDTRGFEGDVERIYAQSFGALEPVASVAQAELGRGRAGADDVSKQPLPASRRRGMLGAWLGPLPRS